VVDVGAKAGQSNLWSTGKWVAVSSRLKHTSQVKHQFISCDECYSIFVSHI
jgi:hypothetical protein